MKAWICLFSASYFPGERAFFFSTYVYMLNFSTYILSLIGAEIIF